MEHSFYSAGTLRYVSEGTSSSKCNDPPTPKNRARTFRIITRTPPTRCSTLSPGSPSLPLQSTSNNDTADEDEDDNSENKDLTDNPSKGSSRADDDSDGPEEPHVAATTLPSLAEIDAALSSSIISSHDTSFCNSLIMSKAERVGDVERMPPTNPRQTPAHKHSSNLTAAAPAASSTTCGEEIGDGGSSANGDTTISSTAMSPHGDAHGDLHIQRPDAVNPAAAAAKKPLPNRGRDESLSAHSPTSPGSSRLRHHPDSPVGDVRTLHDLITWRSHLSGSQRPLNAHNHHNNSHSLHDDEGHGNPMSKSVPTPREHSNAVIAATAFPASTPATPGVWTPTAVTREYLHSPPSLPSLFDHSPAAALRMTAAPVSRHTSCDDIESRSSNASPFSTGSPLHHHRQYYNNNNSSNNPPLHPSRLASSRFSKSEFGDSLPSSSSTSRITSPAMALPLHHHISSPYNSRPHTETEHRGGGYSYNNTDVLGADVDGTGAFPHSTMSSPVLRLPVTARGAMVCDTRRAAQNTIEEHLRKDSGNENSSHAEVRDSSPLPGSSSTPSLHSGWGIEDYAPPHTRRVSLHNLPVLSPIRHNLASCGSDASTSPRGALLDHHHHRHPHPSPQHGFSVPQDAVYGSPISLCSGTRIGSDSPSQASQSGFGAQLHHTHSSLLSASCLPNAKASHAVAKTWRGLQAPEEYPAFATPVDDDTNKAVVAFVTALLLVFCLVFIFSI